MTVQIANELRSDPSGLLGGAAFAGHVPWALLAHGYTDHNHPRTRRSGARARASWP